MAPGGWSPAFDRIYNSRESRAQLASPGSLYYSHGVRRPRRCNPIANQKFSEMLIYSLKRAYNRVESIGGWQLQKESRMGTLSFRTG
jgi:hypothetical protein